MILSIQPGRLRSESVVVEICGSKMLTPKKTKLPGEGEYLHEDLEDLRILYIYILHIYIYISFMMDLAKYFLDLE